MSRVYVLLPLDILDGIWPTGVSLLNRRARTPAQWIATLDREVDRGLLARTGDGTKNSPYQYEEVSRGAFTLRPAEIGPYHRTTQRLLARLGLSDAR